MAFDDILGIPISFEDKEEKKPTVVEKKKDVWDTERYWSLDLEEIWKSDDGPVPEWKVEDEPKTTKGPKPDPEVATEEDLPTLDLEDYDEVDDEVDLDFDNDLDDDILSERDDEEDGNPVDTGPHGDPPPPGNRPIMDILGENTWQA